MNKIALSVGNVAFLESINILRIFFEKADLIELKNLQAITWIFQADQETVKFIMEKLEGLKIPYLMRIGGNVNKAFAYVSDRVEVELNSDGEPVAFNEDFNRTIKNFLFIWRPEEIIIF